MLHKVHLYILRIPMKSENEKITNEAVQKRDSHGYYVKLYHVSIPFMRRPLLSAYKKTWPTFLVPCFVGAFLLEFNQLAQSVAVSLVSIPMGCVEDDGDSFQLRYFCFTHRRFHNGNPACNR